MTVLAKLPPSTPGDAHKYAPGSLRRHPDMDPEKPETCIYVTRTVFNDTDATGCSSWQTVSPNAGSRYLTDAPAQFGGVGDWPDVPGYTFLVAGGAPVDSSNIIEGETGPAEITA